MHTLFLLLALTVPIYAYTRRGARLHAPPPPSRRGAFVPRNSPVYTFTASTITTAIQQTIANDTQAVISEFTGLPDYIQSVLSGSIQEIMQYETYGDTIDEQYQELSGYVSNQLDVVNSAVLASLSSLNAPDGTDTNSFDALKSCIVQVIQQGGLQQGQTCLSPSGLSLDTIASSFQTFTDINYFQGPAGAVNSLTAQVNNYLSSQTLYPGSDTLISDAMNSVQNVVDTTSALERDSINAAFDCYMSALTVVSTVPLDQRVIQCETASGDTTGTTLDTIEEQYQSIVNQYNGVLPPELVTDIQNIGTATLPLSLGSYNSSVRDAVNNAIVSVSSSIAGESASMVASLIGCLNTIYTDTTSTCNPDQDPDVLLHQQNIIAGYLAQYISILPKTLVTNLKNTILPEYEGSSSVDEASLRASLNQLFSTASEGTDYETCYLRFEDCLYSALTDVDSAASTCTMGAECQSLPPLAPNTTGTDLAFPYYGLVSALDSASSPSRRKRHYSYSRYT